MAEDDVVTHLEKDGEPPVSPWHVSDDPAEEVRQLRIELVEAAKELGRVRQSLQSIQKTARRSLMAAVFAVIAVVIVVITVPIGAYAIVHSQNANRARLSAERDASQQRLADGLAANNLKLCILFNRKTSEKVIQSLPAPAQQALRESNARQDVLSQTFGCPQTTTSPSIDVP